MHASAGTIAGGLTGISQNYLRNWLQKATLQNLSADIKGAQLALAAAQRDPWNEKLINLKKLLEVIEIEKNNLESTSEQDSEDDKLDSIKELIKKLNSEIKNVQKKWEKARALHGQHESRWRRIQTAVLASGKAYMGEVSDKENPGLLEGVPAKASMCAKLFSVPLSLVANCAYISSMIPVLLSAAHTNVQGMNFTEFGDIGRNHSSSLLEPTAGINPYANAAYALAGFPLIAGFVWRYQVFHPLMQYLIRPLYGSAGTNADSRKNDTVVNMQNTFAESEDESDNDAYAESNNQESPSTSKSNIDGGSSEDSDSFEPSRSQSSYV